MLGPDELRSLVHKLWRAGVVSIEEVRQGDRLADAWAAREIEAHWLIRNVGMASQHRPPADRDEWFSRQAAWCRGEAVDYKAKLADALRQRDDERRNHIERKHIDATPNDGYPLRILRAYRADCDMRWSLSTTNGGQDATPLMEQLNALQDQRAAILDKAITALAAGNGETRNGPD